jgi:hypothetical protein
MPIVYQTIANFFETVGNHIEWGGVQGGCNGEGEGVQGGGGCRVESPKFMRGNDRVVLSKTHSTPFFSRGLCPVCI